MSTILQIRNRVEFYLQNTELFHDGNDMLLDELNEAKTAMETLHDWKHSLMELTLSVDPTTGGALSACSGLPSGYRFKVAEQWYLRGDDGDTPLYHSSKRKVAVQRREQLRRNVQDYTSRFRGDGDQWDYPVSSPKVLYLGETVYLDPVPSETQTLVCDAYTFLPEYTSNDDTDWFTTNGAEYLKWAAVVALNHRTGTFAHRQEGVIPPPVKMRDAAYAKLVMHDNYLYNTGRTPMT